MKNKLGAVFSVAVGLLMVTGSLWAHHSDAVYDQTRLVNSKGTITKHMFVNPHQVINMKVRDADGRVTKWTIIGAAVSRKSTTSRPVVGSAARDQRRWHQSLE